MNAITGKVIEGLHSEKVELINQYTEYKKREAKALPKSMSVVNTFGDRVVISYKIDEEKLINKQRPVYLGILIYDYSKTYMYKASYARIGLDKLLYTDTDATKTEYDNFIKWYDEIKQNNVIVPHHKEVEDIDPRYKTHLLYDPKTKVFGSFEDELQKMTGDKYVFYCLQKKFWGYFVFDKNNKLIDEKCRYKGLHKSYLIMDSEKDKDIINFVEKDVVYKPLQDEELELEDIGDSVKDLRIYKYFQNNKHKEVDKNNIRLYNDLYEKGEAVLLTDGLRRITSNNKHNVSLEDTERHNKLMNKIKAVYSLKKITINQIKKQKDIEDVDSESTEDN